MFFSFSPCVCFLFTSPILMLVFCEQVARAVRQRNADAQWDVAWWSSSICSFDIRATNSHQGEEAEDMHEERSPPWRWQMYSYGNGNSSIVGPCIALLAQPRRGARQTTYRLMPGQSFEAIREVHILCKRAMLFFPLLDFDSVLYLCSFVCSKGA